MLSNPRKLQQHKTPRTGFVALATAALLLVSGPAFAQEAERLREAKTASKPTTVKRQAANASKTVAANANPASAEEVAELRARVEALTKKVAEQDKKLAEQKVVGEKSLSAGWREKRPFIRSEDGNRQIEFIGYGQADFRAYQRGAAPVNSFVMRRAPRHSRQAVSIL